MVDTLQTLNPTAKQFYDKNLLYRAEASLVLYKMGKKSNLKKNAGNSISWRRFNALPVNTSLLMEGITPAATPLSMTEITGTVQQYGAYCEVSDLLDMTGIDPVITEATDVMGQQAGESIETICAAVLGAGTSVIYANGTARNQVGNANVLTIAMIRKAVRQLSGNNAKKFGGPNQNDTPGGPGTYRMVIHPYQTYDLKNDPIWDAQIKNTDAYTRLGTGVIGMIEGCIIEESTIIPVFPGQGAAGADVYGAIIAADHAFGVVDVGGTGKFQTFAKQLGSAGSADPLDQRATIGWKATNIFKRLNENFMVRLETGVTQA